MFLMITFLSPGLWWFSRTLLVFIILALDSSERISTITVPRFSWVAPCLTTLTMSLSIFTPWALISRKSALMICRSSDPWPGRGRLRMARLSGTTMSSGLPSLASSLQRRCLLDEMSVFISSVSLLFLQRWTNIPYISLNWSLLGPAGADAAPDID